MNNLSTKCFAFFIFFIIILSSIGSALEIPNASDPNETGTPGTTDGGASGSNRDVEYVSDLVVKNIYYEPRHNTLTATICPKGVDSFIGNPLYEEYTTQWVIAEKRVCITAPCSQGNPKTFEFTQTQPINLCWMQIVDGEKLGITQGGSAQYLAAQVTVDSNNDVPETDEGNNIATEDVDVPAASVELQGKADLKAVRMVLSPQKDSYAAGEEVFVTVEIANTGEANSGVFNIKWFEDGRVTGYGSFGNLKPGATEADFSHNNKIMWKLTSGTHTLEYVMDADNMVPEKDETNNRVSATVNALEVVSEQKRTVTQANGTATSDIRLNIVPTTVVVGKGETAEYNIEITDLHRENNREATYTYMFYLKGLPFETDMPAEVTLHTGEGKILTLTVDTGKPLYVVDAVPVYTEVEQAEKLKQGCGVDSTGATSCEVKTVYKVTEATDSEVKEKSASTTVTAAVISNAAEPEETTAATGTKTTTSVIQKIVQAIKPVKAATATETAGSVKKPEVTEAIAVVAEISADRAESTGAVQTRATYNKGGVVESYNTADVVGAGESREYSFTIAAYPKDSNARGATARARLVTLPVKPESYEGNSVSVTLTKGWNLVSLPGSLIKMLDSSSCAASGKKPFSYVYANDGKKYYTMSQAEEAFSDGFNARLSSSSFWIYSYQDCQLDALAGPETALENVQLYPGWNLVPVKSSMSGLKINDISDECSFSALYKWDNSRQQWVKVSEEYQFTAADVNTGFSAKVIGACTLGSKIVMAPPAMPEP